MLLTTRDISNVDGSLIECREELLNIIIEGIVDGNNTTVDQPKK